MWGLFPGTHALPSESNNIGQLLAFVTHHQLRNINLIAIGYASRPHLRTRLTLLRLTLSRNPWAFGDSVSHTVYRYSCQHSHFRYLQPPSRVDLHRLTERSATAQPSTDCTLSFGIWLHSRYIFGAKTLV